MTTLSMDIDEVKGCMGLFTERIKEFEGIKKKLEDLSIRINDAWTSGSATEFKTLHDAQMYVFWTEIEDLKRIRDGLASAIRTYEEAQARLHYR
jgi:hypothetical protein